MYQYKVSKELTALRQEALRLNIPAYDLIFLYVAETPEQESLMLAIKDYDKHDQKGLYNIEKHDVNF